MAVLLLGEVTDGTLSVDATAKTVNAVKALDDITVLCAGAHAADAAAEAAKIARVAKRAGAPANVSAGVRLIHTVGEVVRQGEPLFEIHAESEQQLQFARAYAQSHPQMIDYGF